LDSLFPVANHPLAENSAVFEAPISSGVFDVKPSPVSKLQVNFWVFRLARTGDNWYRAGQVVYGTSAGGNQEASLGRELDVHYWRTFKEKFKAEIGLGHFWAGAWATAPGNTIAGAAPNGSGQSWGYVMGSVLF
jgi:Alginate export